MKNIFCLIGIVFALLSCQKEVEIDLESSNPKLPVFSGWISSQEGVQHISIQTTQNHSSYSSPEYITNATVTVTNNSDVEQFNLAGNLYASSPSFKVENGMTTVSIQVEGKTYQQYVEVFDPIEINDVNFDNETSGLLVGFDLPQEENYAIVFELLADYTGEGTSYTSLTPTIYDMELFENYVEEFNEYGDILLFENLVDSDDEGTLYKLVAHRISIQQYNYLLRIQEQPSNSIYATQPVNLTSMFSNNGLGIVVVSSDSFIEFSF